MQNKDKEDNAFPFDMLLVILLGLASMELYEAVTSLSEIERVLLLALLHNKYRVDC